MSISYAMAYAYEGILRCDVARNKTDTKEHIVFESFHLKSQNGINYSVILGVGIMVTFQDNGALEALGGASGMLATSCA